VDRTVSEVTKQVVALVAALKKANRDKREPKRREKLILQERIRRILYRRFRRQAARVREYFELVHPDRKASLPTEYLEDDQDQGVLIRLLIAAVNGGVELFAETVSIGYDWSAVNMDAAQWAAEYAGELIQGIDETTLQAVQQALEMFITTPGLTIGDVMNALPFGEDRAQRIAVTELTRSYAQGQLIAGEKLQKDYPDMKVTKTWFTNADDIVCDICGPLDGKEVDIDEPFDSDVEEPPAHPNCRCWIETRTRI